MKHLFFIVPLLVLSCSGIRLAFPATAPTATSTPTIISSSTPKPTTTSTASPIPTNAPTHTPSPTPTSSFYTVVEGDTLQAIANNHNLDLAQLAAANHLEDPNIIWVGQKLLIAVEPINTPEPTSLEKQIIVVISLQRAYAFDAGRMVKEFTVSTGLPGYETVTGKYQIYSKFEDTSMSWPGRYHIAHVPWTMYFYEGYALHGAPWNNHLGSPASSGCVNLSVDDAKWLFAWAPVGTEVLVYP